MTKVVNLRKESYDVYIGRGSPFGNPYHVKVYGRAGCIELYARWFYQRLRNDVTFVEQVESLRGKTLGCYCKPLDCHGDIIVEFLNESADR